MKIILTGSSGFIGNGLKKTLIKRGLEVVCIRANYVANSKNYLEITEKNTNITPNLDGIFNNCSVLIHCAGLAETEKRKASEIEHIKINRDTTLHLAKLAQNYGVKRFIFMSSLKVNGEYSDEKPFNSLDVANPRTSYSKSKWEAEIGLFKKFVKSNMEITIIRPPIVYGYGVKGNFKAMISFINKGYPLPLGNIRNKKSLLALDNLIDFVIVCLKNPAAANKIFLVSDDNDISTTDLLIKIGLIIKKPARLITFPSNILKISASIIGQRDVADKLFRNMQADISETKKILNWVPPISIDEGLRRCFGENIDN